MKKINLNGDIFASSFWGDDDVSVETVRGLLENENQDITFNFSTNGGEIFEAVKIYNEIMSYKERTQKQVNFFINGLVASAGTYIMLAGDNIEVSENSAIMIHHIQSIASGSYKDFNNTAKRMEDLENVVIDAYVNKTSLKRKDVINYIDNEAFFFGEDIKNKGFADSFKQSSQSVDESILQNKYLNCVTDLKKSLNQKLHTRTIKNENYFKNQNEITTKEQDMELTLETLKRDYHNVYEQAVNEGKEIGKKDCMINVKAHLNWVEGGADATEVIKNVLNSETFTNEHMSKYSMQAMKKTQFKNLSQDMEETPQVHTPGEQQMVNSQSIEQGPMPMNLLGV